MIRMENENETPGHDGDLFTRFAGSSRDGILLTSDSGSLLEWNPAMEQITGLSRSAVLGKKFCDVFLSLIPLEKRTPESIELFKNVLNPASTTDQSVRPGFCVELEIQRPDNGIRDIESCIFTIPCGDTFMTGAILRDITSRRRSEQSVQVSNQKLRLASSITRHDINNQLTIFNGYLSLMEAGDPAMKSGDIIRILQGANTRIQAILKFTKEYQEVGAKPPEWQDLGRTVQLAKTMVETGTVRFLPAPACNGVEINADPLLVKVFFRLIDNSLLHGGKVSEIRIRCSREEHRLVIVYEDDGTGISGKVRPVLFERGKGKGTGYGMFFVREILAVTGFTITETGEPGKGVRFEIVVPEGSFRMAEKPAAITSPLL
jgi:PAS domain S-box-containing protein